VLDEDLGRLLVSLIGIVVDKVGEEAVLQAAKITDIMKTQNITLPLCFIF